LSCVSLFLAVQEERTPQVTSGKPQQPNPPISLGFDFTPSSVPYFPQNSPTSSIPEMESQPALRMCGSLPNLKMELQSPTETKASEFVSSQLSVSVLVKADMQSEHQMEKKACSDIKLNDLFEGIRSSLLRMIDWSKRLPAFSSLSLEDQMKLLKSSWCDFCTLKLAAQNGGKSDTVILSNGLVCNKDGIQDPEVKRILQRVFSEVACWLDDLNVDRVELACLKGILLFNPGRHFLHDNLSHSLCSRGTQS